MSTYEVGPSRAQAPDQQELTPPHRPEGTRMYIDLSGGQVASDADMELLVNKIARKLVNRGLPSGGVRIQVRPTRPEFFSLHEELTMAREKQVQAGKELYALVTRAREAGTSWEDIADALGISHATLARQYKAGGPIVAARPGKEQE